MILPLNILELKINPEAGQRILPGFYIQRFRFQIPLVFCDRIGTHVHVFKFHDFSDLHK